MAYKGYSNQIRDLVHAQASGDDRNSWQGAKALDLQHS